MLAALALLGALGLLDAAPAQAQDAAVPTNLCASVATYANDGRQTAYRGTPALVVSARNPDSDTYYSVLYQIKSAFVAWPTRGRVDHTIPAGGFVHSDPFADEWAGLDGNDCGEGRMILGIPPGSYDVRAYLTSTTQVPLPQSTSAVRVTVPVAAPTNLNVTPGDGKLDLSWTASSGTVKDYTLDYTSSATVADDADVVTVVSRQPVPSHADGWVKLKADIKGTSYTVGGLANDVRYRVRVAATYDSFGSTWVHGAGTPSGSSLESLSGSTSTDGSTFGGALSLRPAFSPSVTSYTATVPHAVTHVKLTAMPAGQGLIMNVARQSEPFPGGPVLAAGEPSHAVGLSVGTNVINVRVAKGGWLDPKTYAITVTRRAQTSTPSTPTVSLSATPNPVTEDSFVTVTATLSSALGSDVTIPFTVTAGTAESEDYSVVNTNIIIVAGDLSGKIDAAVLTNSDTDTDNETFTVALDTANLPADVVAGSTTSVEVTITDGDKPTDTPTNQPPSNTGGTGGGGGGSSPPPDSDEEPSTPCPQEDREILVSFYKMTDGESWDESENWNSEEHLNQWYGVETDDAGEVVSLRLSGNSLSGDMPTEELRCLDKNTELKELALWGNEDLSGEVPEDFVLAVERAVLREIAETLNINPEWFESYEDPYDFEDWYKGVTTDDDGRVVELDLTGEVPGTLISQLRKLRVITTSSGGGGCALSPKDDSSAFGLFLLTLLVFAALGRKRARG